MATLSTKENYLRMMRGEIPEWVPGMEAFGEAMVTISAMPMFGPPGVMEFEDYFGVPMVVEPASGPIPKPGHFILEDITKWRDVIKRPAILDEIDWEMQAKKDLDGRDPELLKIMGSSIGNGYFMNLTYFMGFDNALIACCEEPEEVKDLLNFILELNLEVGAAVRDYYKPDIWMMGDDIAHERGCFVSDEMFLDIFEPMWRQSVAQFKEAGAFAEHHNCGAFSPFVKYIVDMGFDSWDPAQPTYNDLPAIKKEFPTLSIIGGFESNGICSKPETSEEECRAEVKRTLDELAPGGRFAFGAFVMGLPDDPFVIERNAILNDEYEKRKYDYS